MGWWAIEGGYAGDESLDAFGAGIDEAARAFEQAAGRKPYAAELAEAMCRAVDARPEVVGAADARELLAAWLALPREGGSPRIRARSGDVLRIPYAGDGARAIYGRVLFAPGAAKSERGPGLGHCLVVHDLDATGEPAIDAIRAAPLLLGPCHVSDDQILDGRWAIVGRVTPDDAELPTFADGRGLRDYHGKKLRDTPETRARVVEKSLRAGGALVIAIRMMRGCVRWLPWFTEGLNARRRP